MRRQGHYDSVLTDYKGPQYEEARSLWQCFNGL